MRLEDLIRTTRLSIAQIAVATASGQMPIGTGFLVGSGRYLVTAKHVSDAAVGGSVLTAGLAGVDYDEPDLQLRAAFTYVPMRLVLDDVTNDLALLELMMPPEAVSMTLSVVDEDSGREYSSGRTAPMKLARSRISEGTEVATSGFPLFAPSLVTTRGIIASTFAPVDPTDPNSPIAYLCDVTAINGNSGGPVYRTSDGAVVGVCRAVKLANPSGTPHAVPLLVATPVEHVLHLLASAGISAGPSASPRPPSKKKR